MINDLFKIKYPIINLQGAKTGNKKTSSQMASDNISHGKNLRTII
jgi:hypothetical protein